jgi:hypothetical protein
LTFCNNTSNNRLSSENLTTLYAKFRLFPLFSMNNTYLAHFGLVEEPYLEFPRLV